MTTLLSTPHARLAARLATGAFAVIGLVAVTGLIAVAGSDRHHRHTPAQIAEKIVERLDKKLDLSGTQQEQLAVIFTDNIEQRRNRLQERNKPLKALWQQDSVTADALLEAMKARQQQWTENRTALREQRLQRRAETIAAIHAILTPTQRETAVAMLENMQPFAEGRRRPFLHRWLQWHGRDHHEHDHS